MDELLGEFVSETREMLEQIAGALIAWEAQPGDASRLDEIFRFVHTVKGSCGFLDQPRIEALAHAAETALAEVRSGKRNPDATLVATMLATIDRIGALVAALDAGTRTTAPDAASDAPLIHALETGTATAVAVEADEAVTKARAVRIAVPLLEAMMNQVSELVLVRNELARALRRIDDRDLALSFERLGGVIGDLRESVTRTRMQPIDRLFASLPRLVRETARACGKSVSLEISGQDVEIDREMVEAIRDPLVHIVRNAIDHGIESPVARRAAGKPEVSILRIAAMQSGNQVSIEVRDDGRGIDTAKLVAKALAAKRIDAARAAALDEVGAAQLIFEAGLSTADAVTTLSGRGVGMDVVRANVERLGGAVSLVNRPGQGLSISLRAPLTLSIVNALVVSAGGQSFAIPRGAIEEVVPLRDGGARVEAVGGSLVAVVRGVALPAFDLSTLLGQRDGETRLLVVLSTATGARYALAIGDVGEHEELVVRPMAPLLAAPGIYAGQSLSDEGRPLAVLDPVGLAQYGGLARTAAPVAAEPSVVVENRPSVLTAIADDGRRIAVHAALIERLIEVEPLDISRVGDEVFATVEGAILPAASFADLPADSARPAILLNDGTRRAVLFVARMCDLVTLTETVGVDAPGFIALFRTDGEDALVVDTAGLLSRARVGQRRSALIALDDNAWARGILAPLVEAAGYVVRFGGEGHADLVVHLADDPAAPVAPHTVPLARAPSGGVAIEHYDAAALAALISKGLAA